MDHGHPIPLVQGRDRVALWGCLVAGLLLVVSAATLLAPLLAPHPRAAAAIGAMIVTALAAGREAALSLGLAAGLPWWVGAAVTATIELGILLIGFPFLILGGAWLARRKPIQRMLARAQARARDRPNAGILTLSAITLAPLVPVGALTSVLVGETLGLPRWRLLGALALTNVIANIGFAYGTALALSRFADPALPAAILTGVFVLIALLSGWWTTRAPPTPHTETPM